MSNWVKTRHSGIRYREHPSRRHGANPDRYYSIYMRVDGKLKERGLGWASLGMNEARAVALLGEFKRAAITGEGPRDLDEKRAQAHAQREAEAVEQERQARENISFGEHWAASYFPQCQADKTPRTVAREASFYKVWLGPALGHLPLRAISPMDLERLKVTMAKGGQSPRSIFYALAVVRQVFNHAHRVGVFDGESPTSKVKKPTSDNSRLRFLSFEEAARLLEQLAARSADVHDQVLLALHCGLRAGEIWGLTWGNVDQVHGLVVLRDTKSGKARTVHMTQAVREMFKGRKAGGPDALVFPGKGGVKRQVVSNTFRWVVDSLFNRGVSDPRQKVVFHTLRHTHASWLALDGVDLAVIREQLGHSTIRVTERYAHLTPERLKMATARLEASIPMPPKPQRQPPTYDTGPVVKRRRPAPSY